MSPGQTLHIVITGASSGIGRALSLALAKDGHAVYACARRRELLGALSAEAPMAYVGTCDVSDEAQVLGFLQEVEQRAPQVDALFSAAGSFGAIGPVVEVDSSEWLRTIQVNLFGTFLFGKHIQKLMKNNSLRRIINFAGGGAFDPLPRYSAYATSKAAVVRLTETLAQELASEDIMVNCIAPGFVTTAIHDKTMELGPEIAGEQMYRHTCAKLQAGSVPMDLVIECARYLLTDRASGLTGKTLSVSFDPWDTPEFNRAIPELRGSSLYTQRRMNLLNIENGPLRTSLERAAEELGRMGKRKLVERQR